MQVFASTCKTALTLSSCVVNRLAILLCNVSQSDIVAQIHLITPVLQQ